MITGTELRKALARLGISGADVCVHASMRSMGDQLEGGVQGLTEGFLDLGCTLLVPAFSDMFLARPLEPYMPARNGVGDYVELLNREYDETRIFRPDCRDISTDSMGIFAEYVLRAPGSLRGNHPLNSFAALGPDAAELVGSQTPQDVYAPFRQLCGRGGYVLLLGVTLNRATIIHYAEQLAGRTSFVRWAKAPGGETIPVAIGGCSRGFDNLQAALQPLARRVELGNSVWTLYKAEEMVQACQEAIRQDPQMTRCEDPLCVRCRDAIGGGPVLDGDFWRETRGFTPFTN